MALALRNTGVMEGLEQRSDMIGPRFLLSGEVVYPPKQEESEGTWAQAQSLVDGRWEHVEGLTDGSCLLMK